MANDSHNGTAGEDNDAVVDAGSAQDHATSVVADQQKDDDKVVDDETWI